MKHTQLILLTCLLLILSFRLFPQDADSLRALIEKSHSVDKKLSLQSLLIKVTMSADPLTAKQLAKDATKLAKSSGANRHLGELYGLLGDIAVMEDSLLLAKKYYLQSKDNFEQQEDFKSLVGVLSVLGNIALATDQLAEAMDYYLKTQEYALQEGMNDWIATISLNIGTIYFGAGQLVRAQEYYNIALEESRKIDYVIIQMQVLNNLALTFYELGDYEAVRNYLNEAVALGVENNNPINTASFLINLSRVNRVTGKLDLALENLEEAHEYLMTEDLDYRGPRAPTWSNYYLQKGICCLELGDDACAISSLRSALQNAAQSGIIKTSAKANKHISQYWEQKGNSDSALFYHKMFKQLSDSLQINENIKNIALIESASAHEKARLIEAQEREKERTQNRLTLILMFVVVFILISLSVILFQYLRLSRIRVKQAREEKEMLSAELDKRNKELTTHLMHQVRNNEFILSLSKRIKNLYAKASTENKKIINEIVTTIENDGSGDQWEEFEMRFQEVHTDFYRNLARKYPDLTTNELRLCAFLKLNMNTKDIAAITFQTTNSIAVARHRLRQKFDLEKEANLTSFLAGF